MQGVYGEGARVRGIWKDDDVRKGGRGSWVGEEGEA